MEENRDCPGTMNECHLQTVPCLEAKEEPIGFKKYVVDFKATFAKPWNFAVKPWLKKRYKRMQRMFPVLKTSVDFSSPDLTAEQNEPQPVVELQAGDWVRVKSKEEIEATLNAFKEYKGCAFLDDMYQYCGTTQRVFIKVERFLDERDYKVKTSKGLVYLENLFCTGTKVFGRCDRRCFFFWRMEWLEKIDQESIPAFDLPEKVLASK